MTIGMTLIPIGDAIAKHISTLAPFSGGFLAWSRFVLGAVVLLPVVLHQGLFRQCQPGFLWRQAVRGLAIALTLVFILTAVSRASLAEVFGAFFIGPVVATVLSVIWLKERLGWLGWLAVVLGFAGVLLVVQPSGEFSIGLYYALIAGVFYGIFLAATRWAAGSGPPLAQLCAQTTFGCIFLMPFAIAQLVTMDLNEISPTASLLVIAMAVTSTTANLLSIVALKNASAGFLAPIVYLQVVFATIISWWFFKDTPNSLALIGLVVIIFSGALKIPESVKQARH